MENIIERLKEESQRLASRSFDTVDAGIAANVVDAATGEIERLRSAIVFWSIARYPEVRPDPHDIEGRIKVQEALDLAENTLYQIAAEASAQV